MPRNYSKQAVEAGRRARWEQLQGELGRLRELLSRRGEVQRVILFGSLAEGHSSAHSDLDIAVIADSSRPFLDRSVEYRCYLRPQVPVDLLVYTPEEWQELLQRSRFVQRIAAQGRVVYEAAA